MHKTLEMQGFWPAQTLPPYRTSSGITQLQNPQKRNCSAEKRFALMLLVQCNSASWFHTKNVVVWFVGTVRSRPIMALVFEPASIWNVFNQIKRLTIIQCAFFSSKSHPQNTEDADPKFQATFFGKIKWLQRLLLNKIQTMSLKNALCFFSLAKHGNVPAQKKMLIINFSSHIFYFGPSVFVWNVFRTVELRSYFSRLGGLTRVARRTY